MSEENRNQPTFPLRYVVITVGFVFILFNFDVVVSWLAPAPLWVLLALGTLAALISGALSSPKKTKAKKEPRNLPAHVVALAVAIPGAFAAVFLIPWTKFSGFQGLVNFLLIGAAGSALVFWVMQEEQRGKS